MKTAKQNFTAVSPILNDADLGCLLARTQVMLCEVKITSRESLVDPRDREYLCLLEAKLASRQHAIIRAINRRADRPQGVLR